MVGTILEKGKVVTPVDVLVAMQLLKHDDLEKWRCGRLPYLEQVISCNLTRLSRTLVLYGALSIEIRFENILDGSEPKVGDFALRPFIAMARPGARLPIPSAA